MLSKDWNERKRTRTRKLHKYSEFQCKSKCANAKSNIVMLNTLNNDMLVIYDPIFPNGLVNWIQFWQQCKTARIKCHWVHRQCYQSFGASQCDLHSLPYTMGNQLPMTFKTFSKTMHTMQYDWWTDWQCRAYDLHWSIIIRTKLIKSLETSFHTYFNASTKL